MGGVGGEGIPRITGYGQRQWCVQLVGSVLWKADVFREVCDPEQPEHHVNGRGRRGAWNDWAIGKGFNGQTKGFGLNLQIIKSHPMICKD